MPSYDPSTIKFNSKTIVLMKNLAKAEVKLPHINDVKPYNEDDYAVMAEIREVLHKHGAESRFGVMLLHNHFPIAKDEVIAEFEDLANRQLITKPVKATELHDTYVETQWRLDSMASLVKCVTYCPKDSDGDHVGSVHKEQS